MKTRGIALFAVTVAMVMALTAPLRAEVRTATLHSTALGRDVSCAVHLPPSYTEGAKTYPVVYALHGLFESSQFWQRRGLAPILDDLWARHVLPEFVVVAVDGGNSFFLNSPRAPTKTWSRKMPSPSRNRTSACGASAVAAPSSASPWEGTPPCASR